jgi:hypothetical protein
MHEYALADRQNDARRAWSLRRAFAGWYEAHDVLLRAMPEERREDASIRVEAIVLWTL